MAPRNLPSYPIAIPVSQQEVSSESLCWQNLERATRALHRDGLVVLEDVIDHARLDALNAKMTEDARVLQSAGDASPYNYNKGFIILLMIPMCRHWLTPFQGTFNRILRQRGSTSTQVSCSIPLPLRLHLRFLDLDRDCPLCQVTVHCHRPQTPPLNPSLCTLMQILTTPTPRLRW
jgi:hypothetical protein